MHAFFRQKMPEAFSKRKLSLLSVWKVCAKYYEEFNWHMRSAVTHSIKAVVFSNCTMLSLAIKNISWGGNKCKMSVIIIEICKTVPKCKCQRRFRNEKICRHFLFEKGVHVKILKPEINWFNLQLCNAIPDAVCKLMKEAF